MLYNAKIIGRDKSRPYKFSIFTFQFSIYFNVTLVIP